MLETLDQVRSWEPVRPRQLQPGVPGDLETICLKCLEKNPRRRFVSADALADDLDRFLEGRPIVARAAGLTAHANWWPAIYEQACAAAGVPPDPAVLAFAQTYEGTQADLKRVAAV